MKLNYKYFQPHFSREDKLLQIDSIFASVSQELFRSSLWLSSLLHKVIHPSRSSFFGWPFTSITFIFIFTVYFFSFSFNWHWFDLLSSNYFEMTIGLKKNDDYCWFIRNVCQSRHHIQIQPKESKHLMISWWWDFEVNRKSTIECQHSNMINVKRWMKKNYPKNQLLYNKNVYQHGFCVHNDKW